MIPLSSPSRYVQAVVDGSIGWIVLNRPERRNALNRLMWAALPPLMKSLDEHVDVRVIVIRGVGADAFSAGADISEFGENRNDTAAANAYEDLNSSAFTAIRSSSKPVIAMIQGFCIGGGLALALACDLRIADDTAVFSLPPARLGLAYPVDALRDLVATVGAPAAKEMLFTARRLKSPEALAIRLLDRMVSDIEPEIRTLCSTISEGAPLSITHAKRAIDLIAGRPGHVGENEVMALAARCFESADYQEGRTAFAEKRQARFSGR